MVRILFIFEITRKSNYQNSSPLCHPWDLETFSIRWSVVNDLMSPRVDHIPFTKWHGSQTCSTVVKKVVFLAMYLIDLFIFVV